MLCRAFLELLRKYSFPKITVQMIAGQCGVNRQTFYYYFDNIYDLMAKAFEYEITNERTAYAEETWESFMRRFLYWMRDNRVIIKNILFNVESKYLRQAIYPIISKGMNSLCHHDSVRNIDDEAEENDIEKDEFVIHFLVLGVTQYVLEWADGDFKESVEEVVDNLCSVLEKVYD